jgi:hypothetical protein
MHYLSHLANAYSLKATDIGLPNSTQNIGGGLVHITEIVTYLVGGLAIIFIIVGGLQMVTSNGDPRRFATGRETIIYAMVGIAVAIASFAIVAFINSKV